MAKELIHMIMKKKSSKTLCGQSICRIRHHTNYEDIVTCPACLIAMEKERDFLKSIFNTKTLHKRVIDKYLNPQAWDVEK